MRPGDVRRVGLPDHGDVWSATWDVVDAGADHVELAVDCRTVPVRVARRLGVAGAATGDTVRLDYTVTNVGGSPAPGFWMAHPLFDATDLVDVTFESAGVEWHCTIAAPAPVPTSTSERDTSCPTHSHQAATASTERPPRRPPPPLHARDGAKLRITWDLPVPVHVQLWVDNATIGGVPVVAVEPATAAGDDPVAARAGRRAVHFSRTEGFNRPGRSVLVAEPAWLKRRLSTPCLYGIYSIGAVLGSATAAAAIALDGESVDAAR